MNWILIAIVSGSILTSGHDTREQCLGRKALLAEQKIEGKCVEAPGHSITNWSGHNIMCLDSSGNPRSC
jgi:hypothetical protein